MLAVRQVVVVVVHVEGMVADAGVADAGVVAVLHVVASVVAAGVVAPSVGAEDAADGVRRDVGAAAAMAVGVST